MSRLPLTEFNVKLSSLAGAFAATQDSLQTIIDLFRPGQSICPPDFDDAIKCLLSIREHSCNFHAFIEQSGHLPLVIVPLRLPLLLSLTDVDIRIAKLKRLLATLQEEIWKTQLQPVEQKLAIWRELDELQLNCKEVLDQVSILKKNLQYESDKSRFEKRLYSVVR
jgi:hypothetical protein